MVIPQWPFQPMTPRKPQKHGAHFGREMASRIEDKMLVPDGFD